MPSFYMLGLAKYGPHPNNAIFSWSRLEEVNTATLGMPNIDKKGVCVCVGGGVPCNSDFFFGSHGFLEPCLLFGAFLLVFLSEH